jgi:hypothetical protein
MKVRFIANFDYTPSLERRVTIAYRAGWRGTVKRECAERAIAEGAAVPVKENASAPQSPADPE